jgi:hypothetical protein
LLGGRYTCVRKTDVAATCTFEEFWLVRELPVDVIAA